MDILSTPKNNAIYQKMVEEIQDYAIILLNKTGIIQNWNAGAEKIKLYKDAEIIGKHFSTFYFEDDLKSNIPGLLLKDAELFGRAYHEGWRKRKDETGFWGSITITALHDDNANTIGFVKVTRDLTERKLAEDQLKLSEERYHQMVAEVEDYAIILLDEEGVIRNWNVGAEKIKGYSGDEIICKKLNVFYTSTDLENNLPEKLLELARQKGKATQEGWRVRKDGTTFWGTIVITALHGKKNEIIGFSKVTRDLTDKKLAEEKMLAYTAELEIRNKELEQFAYVASHDLQEPLRKIRTFAQLIRDNYSDFSFFERYMQKLDLSARRMSELIHSLLNFSRLANKLHEKVDTNLDDVLKDVLEDMELLIAEKKAIIEIGKLPVISAFKLQLNQLFANLISNSLKFNTMIPVIIIEAAIVLRKDLADMPDHMADEKYIRISVKDNGIGFEARYNNLIFNLFQRLHERAEFEGTGIGLALCKKITENHNGHITASGELEKGTTIDIYLPLKS